MFHCLCFEGTLKHTHTYMLLSVSVHPPICLSLPDTHVYLTTHVCLLVCLRLCPSVCVSASLSVHSHGLPTTPLILSLYLPSCCSIFTVCFGLLKLPHLLIIIIYFSWHGTECWWNWACWFIFWRIMKFTMSQNSELRVAEAVSRGTIFHLQSDKDDKRGSCVPWTVLEQSSMASYERGFHTVVHETPVSSTI